MDFDLRNLEVIGTGSYLPAEIIETDYFEDRELWAYDKNGNRIGEPRRFTKQKLIDLTGILRRRKSAPNEWPSDMGYNASKIALERAEVEVDSLVGIIVATVSERDNFPSAAVKIQERLGAKNVEVAYDLQNACAGFPIALNTANALSRETRGNWLVVASETLTKLNDYTDINCHLFGDGAGAVVLGGAQNGRGIRMSYSKSEPFEDGSGMIFRDSRANCIRMPDGAGVLRRAVDAMYNSVVFLKNKLSWERADVYVPHQANDRIITGVEKRLKEDNAKVYRNISEYGNMSAATCAVALDEAIRDETIKDGSRVILTSFGAGLVTSAVAIQF